MPFGVKRMSTQLGLTWRVLCVIFSFCTAEAAASGSFTLRRRPGTDTIHSKSAPLSLKKSESAPGFTTGPYRGAEFISVTNLRGFDAVLFFTSGELALDDSQRAALLDFVRRGGSFGGFHSATDTLYSWQQYGEMVGAYFDGHPWTQPARVVRASDDPVGGGIAYPWSLTEEFYQFRLISSFRTLQMLDTTSVDLNAPGVKASSFPLTWVREYGEGRVFYTALGHFGDTWQSRDFQQLLENAMRWLLQPRAPGTVIAPGGIGNAATMSPGDAVSPGAIISVYGSGLVSKVSVEGQDVQILYASPTQINAVLPLTVTGRNCPGWLQRSPRIAEVTVGNASRIVQLLDMTPGIFAATVSNGAVTVWMTGLGTGEKDISATIAGLPCDGSVPWMTSFLQFPGLYQVNLTVPHGTPPGSQRVEVAGAQVMVMLP